MRKRGLVIVFLLIGLVGLSLYGANLKNLTSDQTKKTLRLHAIGFWDNEYVKYLFYVKELEKKYDIIWSSSNPDIVLTSQNLEEGKVNSYPNAIKIHYSGEVFRGNSADHIASHDLVMATEDFKYDNYIRLPYYQVHYSDRINHKNDSRGKCNPNKKYFACFLVSNGGWHEIFDNLGTDKNWENVIRKYEKEPDEVIRVFKDYEKRNIDIKEIFQGARDRNDLFHALSLYKFVASGGKYLRNMKESPTDAEKWLSDCKFVIAYENQYYPHYITEKPFQAWFSGAVPIYNAHGTTLSDFNKKATIFAGDFESREKMIDYIKQVDQDDQKYCEIWNESIFTKDAGKDFVVIEKKVNDRIAEIIKNKLGK